MGPLAYAEAAVDAAAGDSTLHVKRAQNIVPGMRLWIEANGEIDSFTKKPRPYHLAMVKAVQADRLELVAPLKFPVPQGTVIRHADAPNLVEIRGESEDVRIENLTIDGGRLDSDPVVRTHAQLCGIFASSNYSYEKGPSGPKVKKLSVAGCIIRHCSGRGIAFYAVEKGLIEKCRISDTNDEGIDLDHFSVNIAVRQNHVERSHVGIELNDASDCLVENNVFTHCNLGFNLWRWCKQPGLNERNKIVGNVFADSESNGMTIAKGTADNLISRNEITNAGLNGISLSGNHQTVTQNHISGFKKKSIAILEGEHVVADNE
jgi:parallel beta-helix repeat protein